MTRMEERMSERLHEERPKCPKCGRPQRRDCDSEGWLEAIGPCADGSYITSRPCPNNGCAEARPSPAVREDGARPLPFDRDELGRMVREAWVRWAETQPNPKPSWLVPYSELAEPDKEADRQIGEAIARWTLMGASGEWQREPTPEMIEAAMKSVSVFPRYGTVQTMLRAALAAAPQAQGGDNAG